MKPLSPAPRSKAVRDDDTDAWIGGSAERGRQEEVDRARAFARFDRQGSFIFHGAASMPEYAARYGYGRRQTLWYVAAGYVFEVCPQALERVREGALAISTVASLAPLLLEEGLVLRHASGRALRDVEILDWARLRSDRDIRRTVARLREEVRIGAQTTARTFHLSSQGIEDLERAQTLLSRKKSRLVSQSEAVQDTLREWVARHDPMETTPGTRRMPPRGRREDGTRNPRGVAAEVDRELKIRSGDRCQIEGCEHKVWLHNAHKWPHALGGGNEVQDQVRLCFTHHAMWDHGEMRWVAEASAPGGGWFETLEGRVLRLRPPEGQADRVGERGPWMRPSGRGRRAHRRRRPPPRGFAAGAWTGGTG